MPKLLLVDDSADFRAIFQQHFTRQGYEVLTAPDGVRGLQLFMNAAPDLVVLDWSMPHRGGLETLELIRSVLPDARVLVLTALMDDLAQAQARELGVADILFKPLGLGDLAAAIQRALEGTRE